MIKTKQHIALIFSSLAMLALLLHGILPHHHHNSETEKCNVEEHQTVQYQADCENHYSFSVASCCEEHHSNTEQVHACSLNVEASKQIQIGLIAVIKNSTFQYQTTQIKHRFVRYSNLFTPSVFSDVRSLRAPPLG